MPTGPELPWTAVRVRGAWAGEGRPGPSFWWKTGQPEASKPTSLEGNRKSGGQGGGGSGSQPPPTTSTMQLWALGAQSLIVLRGEHGGVRSRW